MSLLRNLLKAQGQNVPVREGDIPPLSLVQAPAAELPVNFLKDELDAQDRLMETSRIGGTADGYTHVSSLVTACARREVLAPMLTDAQKAQVATGGHRLMWEYGRVAEKHIRTQMIARKGQHVYGRWECACGKEHIVGTKPSKRCVSCRGQLDIYKEQPVRDEERMIVGNPDMPLILNGDLVITEIKSMNKSQWTDLEAPLGDHVLQAAMYRAMYENNGWKVHPKVIILYAVKEFTFGSPYKEFHIDCTRVGVETNVALVYEAAEDILRHREAGTYPRRTVCHSPNSPIARQCPAQGLCFNMD
jgi:hypothetical protein